MFIHFGISLNILPTLYVSQEIAKKCAIFIKYIFGIENKFLISQLVVYKHSCHTHCPLCCLRLFSLSLFCLNCINLISSQMLLYFKSYSHFLVLKWRKETQTNCLKFSFLSCQFFTLRFHKKSKE